MGIHELYGRLAEAREADQAAHLRTLETLRAVVQGDLDPARVEVTGATWRVLPPAPVELTKVGT